MGSIIGGIIPIAALVFFVWMLRKAGSNPDAEIDPTDDRTIGNIIGLTGGSVADAAVVRYALERFEKANGRKATVRDMAIVVGMVRAG